MTLHVRFPAGLIDLASADLEVDPDELASVATVVAASAMDLHADELARAIDRTVMRTLFVIGEREDGKMGWSTTCKKKSQEVSYELTREIPRDKGEIGAIDNDVSWLMHIPRHHRSRGIFVVLEGRWKFLPRRDDQRMRSLPTVASRRAKVPR